LKRGARGLAECFARQRWRFLAGLAALAASDVCQLITPACVRRGIDAVTAGGAGAAQVRREAVAVAALTVAVVAFRFLWRHFLFTGARIVEMDLRERLLTRALALPAAWHARTRTGELMALATNDLMAVRMALAMGPVTVFDSTVFVIVALVAQASIDWRLTVFTTLPFIVLGLVLRLSLRNMYARSTVVQEAFERLTEKVRESLSGMRVLRGHAQEEGDVADFERFSTACVDAQMASVRVDAVFNPSVMALTGLSTAILLGVGGTQVVEGQMSLGAFTAFSAYLGLMSWPMIAAGWTLSLMGRGTASMERVMDLLDREPEPDIAGQMPVIAGTIEARDLSFAYPGNERKALDRVSFRVAPGGTLGIVGEVGSGKSTLAALLLRVYAPPAGSLRIDGIDVNDIDLAHLRRHVSMVSQEAFLFSESIADNLRLGAPDASDERLIEACRLAAVHDEITEFPEGYETLLGERGITLSGGQKQRVCLARALLKTAPILVLDDTLSAVDADTEARILCELERERREGRRTSVIIAHRVSAVRDADCIVVLRDGSVVEQGTHAELIARGGAYAELHALQQLEGESASRATSMQEEVQQP